MRRLSAALLAIAITGILTGGTVANARWTTGCQEISIWLPSPKIIKRVCYPCPPSSVLPPGTPSTIKQIWTAEVCPAPTEP
jgi:hypothetical protein